MLHIFHPLDLCEILVMDNSLVKILCSALEKVLVLKYFLFGGSEEKLFVYNAILFGFATYCSWYQSCISHISCACDCLSFQLLICSPAREYFCLDPLELGKPCSRKQLPLKRVRTLSIFQCQVSLQRWASFETCQIVLSHMDHVLICFLSYIHLAIVFPCCSGLVRVRNMWRLSSPWLVKLLRVSFLLMKYTS